MAPLKTLKFIVGVLSVVVLLSCNRFQNKESLPKSASDTLAVETKDSNSVSDSADMTKNTSIKSLVAINCEEDPDNQQLAIIQGLIQQIKQQTNDNSFLPMGYKPPNCPMKPMPDCKSIFKKVSSYLNEYSTELTFCIVDTDSWLAGIDMSSKDRHMFISSKFFKTEEDEQLRSLIHEIHHLQGNLAQHPHKSDCSYFDNDALRAEHCLTGAVSYKPTTMSSCSSNGSGLFIIEN